MMTASLRDADHMLPLKLENFKPAGQNEDAAHTSFTGSDGDTDVCLGTSVTVNGVRFGKIDVIVLTGEDSELSFGSVNLAVVHPDWHVALRLTPLEWDYDGHRNAFKVHSTTCEKGYKYG